MINIQNKRHFKANTQRPQNCTHFISILLHAMELGMKLLQDKEKIMGVSPTWLPRDSYGFLTPRCSPHKISLVIISKACNNTEASVTFFTSEICHCCKCSRQNIFKKFHVGGQS
jgi:hypothetical protein